MKARNKSYSNKKRTKNPFILDAKTVDAHVEIIVEVKVLFSCYDNRYVNFRVTIPKMSKICVKVRSKVIGSFRGYDIVYKLV